MGAPEYPGFRHVGWRNPRSGHFHKLKFDVSVGRDWEPVYVRDESVFAWPDPPLHVKDGE